MQFLALRKALTLESLDKLHLLGYLPTTHSDGRSHDKICKNTTKTFPYFLLHRSWPGVAFPLHFRVLLIPLSSSTGEVGPFDPPVFLRYRRDSTVLMLCCVIKTSEGARMSAPRSSKPPRNCNLVSSECAMCKTDRAVTFR